MFGRTTWRQWLGFVLLALVATAALAGTIAFLFGLIAHSCGYGCAT